MTKKQDKLEVRIDVTDWKDEVQQEEIIITDVSDVVTLLGEGKHTAKIARATIVNRELGNADDDIIRPNKILFQTGAIYDVSQIAMRQREEFETKTGKTYKVRSLVGSTGDEDDDRNYVKVDSLESIERAEKYLLTKVTGHITNRLRIIAYNEGDVRGVADELKSRIDSIVHDLVNRVV